MKIFAWPACLLPLSADTFAQQDSSVNFGKKTVTLKEVVIRNSLNVGGFIERVKNDTTFYKAFKNLKMLGYTALNDIRMRDKDRYRNRIAAKQNRYNWLKMAAGPLKRWKRKLRGDIYDEKHKLELLYRRIVRRLIVCQRNCLRRN